MSEPSTRVLNGVNLTRLDADSPDDMRVCGACGQWIQIGQPYTTIRLGPGSDPIERQRAREGAAYNAVRVPVHWACATGEED